MMKIYTLYLCSVFGMILLCRPAFIVNAQDVSSTESPMFLHAFSKVNITIHGGVTGSALAGPYTDEQRDVRLNHDSTYLTYSTFKPSLGFMIVGMADYLVNERFTASGGLMLRRLTNSHSVFYGEYDPEYRYDREMIDELHYQLFQIGIPVVLKYNKFDRFIPFAGVNVLLPVSSKVKVNTTDNIIINGKIDEKSPRILRDTLLNHKDFTTSVMLSLNIGMEVPISTQFGSAFTIERSTIPYSGIAAGLWCATLSLYYKPL